MKTKTYPLTVFECVKKIGAAERLFGKNEANAMFGYRKQGFPGAGGGTVAFAFIESKRTAGAYKQIAYCS